MRGRKPNVWSLERPDDLVFLSLGTAVGVSNFFVFPSLVIYGGGISVFLVHLLGLVLLGTPLAMAEMIWGRWLLRPYSQSFKSISPKLRWIPLVTTAAVLFLAPPYFVDLGRIWVLLTQAFVRGASGPWSAVESSPLRSFLGAFFVLSLCLLLEQRPAFWIARAMKALMCFALPVWAALSWWTIRHWGYRGLMNMLYGQSFALPVDTMLGIVSFSLFSLSAGFGILYTYVFYASQIPLKASPEAERVFWSRQGRLFRTVGWILAGDLAAFFASLVLVSPYGLGPVGPAAPAQTSVKLIFEWVPELMLPSQFGPALVLVYFLSLAAAGTAAALSLFDWCVFNFESELKWPRLKAAFHVWIIGACLVTLALVPAIKHAMSATGLRFWLPLSALLLSLSVGWKMPVRAQRQIFGRGLLLDRLFWLWLLSIRYLIPFFLVYLLIRLF